MSSPTAGTPMLWRAIILIAVSAITYLAWLVRETIGLRGQSLVGIFCFLGMATAFSTNLRGVNWRTVLTGILLQLSLAVVILKIEFVYHRFEEIGQVVTQFLKFAEKGSDFVFGPLANIETNGFIFAIQALPTVIFVSAVFTVLYHLRILQAVVWVFAKLMMIIFGKRGVSGAESLAATANVFMGQTEAPLIIKPYVARMTKSELLALMIGGMATISGGVMAVYINMGGDAVAILATSVMAAPSGLYLSKLLLPELQEPETRGQVKMNDERPHANVIDAAAGGASDGMMLVINIIAMLIAFIAGIAMVNYLLAQIGAQLDMPYLSLEWIFSKVFAPLAFLTGVHPDDVPRVGELLGKKLVLNEFVAFKELTDANAIKDPKGKFLGVKDMSERSYKLTAYALTGFANFSSIGIQIGGIGAMAPSRRKDLAQLGMLALLGGFLATLINAAVAGLMIP